MLLARSGFGHVPGCHAYKSALESFAANELVFRNQNDAAGNLTNHTDGADNAINYTYDVLNRPVARDAFKAEVSCEGMVAMSLALRG